MIRSGASSWWRTATATAATTLASAATAAAKKAAENIVAKNVAELAEYVVHIHAAGMTTATHARSKCSMAIAVVLGFFIGIA